MATADDSSSSNSKSNKDNVILRKPFRGYAETLRGSVVTVSPSLGSRSPFQ